MWHTKRRLAAAATALMMLFSVTGLSAFAEENAAEAAETEQSAVISSWNWADHMDNLTESEDGTWTMNVPGVSESNPLTREALQELLPTQIITVNENDETANLSLTWDLSAVPEEGITSGNTSITASVEGYAFSSGEEAISVVVSVPGAAENTAAEGASAGNSQPSTNEISTYAADEYDKYTVQTVPQNGTIINLFDYWMGTEGDDFYSNDRNPTDYLTTGINVDKDGNKHMLHFLKNADKGEYECNTWKEGDITQGIVSSNLSSDGYPELTNGSESLSYLFDESDEGSDGQPGKAAYMNVEGLLQVDTSGYFYYDATKNYAYYDADSNKFKVYNTWGVNSNPYKFASDNDGQFFPFNPPSDVFSISQWNSFGKKNIDASSSELNHWFGLSMSSRFVQQDGGHDANDNEVTYEFSGDDDVWVFIDGVLVGDLGGIHNKADLSINFSTGAITITCQVRNADGQLYPKKYTTTLKEQFEDAGKTWNSNTDTFADDTYHTLQFFYLERGGGASNMKLKYNLVSIPESSVIKVDQTGNPVAGAEFSLKTKNDNTEIASGITDHNGEFIFYDPSTGLPLSINQIYENCGSKNLLLEEKKVPVGYRASEPLELYFYGNDKEKLLLSDNAWDTGGYAMTNVTTTLPNSFNAKSVLNNNNRNFTPDEHDLMFAVVMKKTSSGNWVPVYGDPVHGWITGKNNNSFDEILNAVKATNNIFTLSTDGSYKCTIEDLPGDVKKYRHFNQSDFEYTVAYYIADNADSLNDVTQSNTYLINGPDYYDNDSNLERIFSAKLYVPNIKNNLYVQKTDINGNAISSTASFALYPENDINVNPDGTYTVKQEQYRISESTQQLTTPFNIDGCAFFTGIPVGTYYLVEAEEPNGYVKNDKATKIIVDNSGVYAYADSAKGFTVRRGVGAIVKSMVQFASKDNIDLTLHDITAQLETCTDDDIADGSVWTKQSDSKYLSYGANSAVLEYGLTSGGDDSATLDNLTFEVTSGWSRIEIRQNYKNEVSSDLKQNLNDQNLSNLFSGTTIVQVANEKKGSLSITKHVVDNTNTVPEQTSYNFEISSSDISNGSTIPCSYNDNQTCTLTFNAGKASFSLKKDQTIIIDNLPASEADLSEVLDDYPAQDTELSVSVTVNGGNLTEAQSVTNVSISNDSQTTVVFTNTFSYKTKPFSFIKIDGTNTNSTLGGAQFKLFKKLNDAESDELIDVNNFDRNKWEAVMNGDNAVFTSDDKTGTVDFGDLQYGEYRLVEIKAPDGYQLPSGQWKVSISADEITFINVGDTQAVMHPDDGKYYLPNYKPVDPPLTGGNGISVYLYSIGALLMGFGFVMIYRKYRKG